MGFVFIDDDNVALSVYQEVVRNIISVNLIGVFSNVEDFLEKEEIHSSVKHIFLDIDLPTKSGLESIPYILNAIPNVDITMLTINENPELMIKCFEQGACGYLSKRNSIGRLKEEIETICNGGAVIDSQLARYLINYFRSQPLTTKSHPTLNEKENAIMSLIADGKSYKMVAGELDMDIDNVRYYIKKIYRLLEVNSKVEAINKYNS